MHWDRWPAPNPAHVAYQATSLQLTSSTPIGAMRHYVGIVSAGDDLPDIRAYAEAPVTSPEVAEKFARRRFVADYEREDPSRSVPRTPGGGGGGRVRRVLTPSGLSTMMRALADRSAQEV